MSLSRPSLPRPGATALAALLAGLVAGVLGGCGDGTQVASCTTFPNQAAAQRAADTLDGDGDGRFCERLPCPCLEPDGSTTPPGAPRGRDSARPSSSSNGVATGETGRIDRVIDGDTIDVRLSDGRRQRVRLIGIDAPESTTLRTGRAQCAGQDAKHAAEALARRWPTVRLTTDDAQDPVDRFGRMLAYVSPTAAPSTSFQLELLQQGWARVYVYGGRPFGQVGAFRAAAGQARSAGSGVWSLCGGDFQRPL